MSYEPPPIDTAVPVFLKPGEIEALRQLAASGYDGWRALDDARAKLDRAAHQLEETP